MVDVVVVSVVAGVVVVVDVMVGLAVVDVVVVLLAAHSQSKITCPPLM